MRLEWIEDILAVLDTGSLARAAEKRNLTQSAFTRRARMIEESIGAPIFDRSRKPVRLLPGILALENDLRAAATRLRALRDGLRLSAGHAGSGLGFICQHAITATVSPWIVKALSEDGQGTVRVRSGNLDECLLALMAQEVDFAVTYEVPGDQTSAMTRTFASRVLGRDMLIPVCTPALQPAARGTLIPTIRYPSNAYLGDVFERWIAPRLPQGVTTAPRAETALTLAMLQFARDDIGIAWVPETLAADALARGVLIRVDDILPAQALDIRLVHIAEADRAPPPWAARVDALQIPSGLEALPNSFAHLIERLE